MLRFASLLSFVTATALLAILTVPTAQAQMEGSSLSADRPGFGDGASTVNAGTFQAELGYAFNSNGINSHKLGQLLLRYGVTGALELRGGINSYVVNESPVDNGYNGTGIGAKLRLFQNPTSKLSGVATVSLPTGTGAYESIDDRARQSVKLAFDGALGDGLTLSVNGGTSFFYDAGLQEDRAVQWLFIPTLTFGVSDNADAYVGYAGVYNEASNTNWVEGGLTFLSNVNTQFDVNTGVQVDDNGDAMFVGVGVTHRF